MSHVQLPNGKRERVAPIIVAVEDPALHPEALQIAAACGRPVVCAKDGAELARLRPRAFALLVDAQSKPPEPLPAPNTFLLTTDFGEGGPGSFALPAQSADLLRALGALNRLGAPKESGRVLAVVGAAGGVGASTLGAALCRSANESTLVDAHRRSGGLDLLLGIEAVPGARWGEIEFGDGVVARADVRRALPMTPDGIAVLTYPRTTIADQVIASKRDVEAVAATVGTDGLTVLDVPAELVPQRCDLACIVMSAQLRAAASAARIAADLNATGVPHVLVVRDEGWQALSSDELEQITGSRILARIPTVRGLTRSVERGGLTQRLPRQLRRPADAILGEVSGR